MGKTGPRGGHRDGLIESMAKSTARTIGSQIGREVVRGVLGSILGGGQAPPVTSQASYRAIGVAMAIAGVVCFRCAPS
mgnify:CR=1 FL=1